MKCNIKKNIYIYVTYFHSILKLNFSINTYYMRNTSCCFCSRPNSIEYKVDYLARISNIVGDRYLYY